MRPAALLLALALPLVLGGCGYTAQEWGAQQSALQRLQKKSQATDAKLDETSRELTAEKQRAAELEQSLTALGVDLEHRKEEVQRLAATLEEREKALAEHRERVKQLEQTKARFDALQKKLESLTSLGIEVSVRHNRMVISLPGDVLFDTDRTSLKKGGKEALTKVAEVLRGDPALLARSYQVAGHTDAKPKKGGAYADNWGLSVMRAREVLLFLLDAKGGALPAERWSAAGYSDTDPVAGNDTPEGRQKNRRCEIVVLPNVEEMLDLRSLLRP